jgi:hypothetical protein
MLQMGNTLQSTLLTTRGGLKKLSPLEIGLIGAGSWVGTIFIRASGYLDPVSHPRRWRRNNSPSCHPPWSEHHWHPFRRLVDPLGAVHAGSTVNAPFSSEQQRQRPSPSYQ